MEPTFAMTGVTPVSSRVIAQKKWNEFGAQVNTVHTAALEKGLFSVNLMASVIYIYIYMKRDLLARYAGGSFCFFRSLV